MRRLVFAAFLLLAASAFAQRLPRTVQPNHYDLTFTPDFASDRYDGEETIHVTISQPVSEIVLNAVNIEFREVQIESGARTQNATAVSDAKQEQTRLTVAEPLTIGPARIRIRFRGTLNNTLKGLYLGNANGRKFASTQMEATDAREAFPCFDEPDMKATFAITAVIDTGHIAISNGAVVSDTPGPAPGKHTVRFSTTPRISSYLVALTIGDFQCIGPELADGIPIRVCGTPDKIALGRYALDSAKFILPFFNQYYGVRYPFGKLDHTGVADFRAGAMENAGAIIYRDAALFLDPKEATPEDLRGTASVISHETAHMWFGDIVTMRWWNDIWLNEGFATWATAKPLAAMHPEWNIPLRTVAGIGGAMSADSLRTSRKIRQEATTPEEIDELFDGIAYGKTASVLQMLESFIGEEPMRKGVSSYLQKYSFGNATYHDFSDAIKEASSQPVDQILASFVEQPGVPLLRVASSCEGGNTNVTIEQERFFLDGSDSRNDQRWTLPVCYGAAGSKKCEVVRDRRQTVRVAGCGSALFLNAGGYGYYVVEHSPAMLTALTSSLGGLAPAERLVLARDEWQLVRSARRPVGSFLTLAEAMRGEREPLVLANAVGAFYFIRENIASDADRAPFEKWVRAYMQPIVKELGWAPKPGESSDLGLLRAMSLNTLHGAGQDPAVAREARRLVERELAGKIHLEPQLRSTFIALAASAGDEKLYERYRSAMKAAKTPDEYYQFFYALAQFRDPALLRRTLEWSLTPEVKNQDAGGLISSVATSMYGEKLGWEWIEQNWDRIAAKLPERMLGGVLGAGRVFCDKEGLARVKAFYDAHPIPSAARRNAQTLERIAQCAALKDLQSAALHEWLVEKAGN